MKTKMGRPKLPPGESKDFQIGVRFNSKEAEPVQEAIKASRQPKAEWARQALQAAGNFVWTAQTRWTVADLHGKSVQYSFQVAGPNKRVLNASGIGDFRVWTTRHRPGELAIEIETTQRERGVLSAVTFPLTQSLVDRIEIHPDTAVADYRCFR